MADGTRRELGDRIPRLQRLQAMWNETQDRRRNDPTCAHPHREAFAQRLRNGAWQLWVGCADCALNLDRRWLPHTGVDWDEHGRPVGHVIIRDCLYENPPCRVCGAFGTELHHWAPRSVFGDEANHWPTDHLCPPCHSAWHDRIKGVPF